MFKSLTGNDKRPPARGKGTPVTELAPPPPVQWAVRLMYAGAGLSGVFLIFALIVTSNVKSALIKWNATLPKKQQYTLSQINNAATSYIVSTIIIGLIAIGLWLWMARLNNRGRNWARIAATVFFALWTYYTYESIGTTRGSATFITATAMVLIIWLVGLAALFFLWRAESTAYFKSGSS